MKTKYFSNAANETLDDLQANVNKWIASRKNIKVIEMKTSTPSKTTPNEFFIRMDYDDKMPPKIPNGEATSMPKRRF